MVGLKIIPTPFYIARLTVSVSGLEDSVGLATRGGVLVAASTDHHIRHFSQRTPARQHGYLQLNERSTPSTWSTVAKF